ncbi:MAG: FkbM family methyltransferase [bacterium]|nr:FkbM family methyltransferase [bacterium]
MMKDLLYNPFINKLIRISLKPFSEILPARLKFPINGIFTVRGKKVPPFKMATNQTSAVTKFLFWGNVEGFEYHAVKVFEELTKNSKVFFDIGANIGYYSLLASAIKNKDIYIYAFEPMPSAYQFLLQNISLNQYHNIKPMKLALSNEKGRATFYSIANPKFKELPQLTGDGSLNNAASGNSFKVNFEVDIDTLDNFVAGHLGNEKIDLIKLDTEANEHKVLAGADHVLRFHRPIIQCEILKNQIETEMESILADYDYLYFRATNKGLLQVTTFGNNNSPFMDYYLVPTEKKELISDFLCRT